MDNLVGFIRRIGCLKTRHKANSIYRKGISHLLIVSSVLKVLKAECLANKIIDLYRCLRIYPKSYFSMKIELLKGLLLGY